MAVALTLKLYLSLTHPCSVPSINTLNTVFNASPDVMAGWKGQPLLGVAGRCTVAGMTVICDLCHKHPAKHLATDKRRVMTTPAKLCGYCARRWKGRRDLRSRFVWTTL